MYDRRCFCCYCAYMTFTRSMPVNYCFPQKTSSLSNGEGATVSIDPGSPLFDSAIFSNRVKHRKGDLWKEAVFSMFRFVYSNFVQFCSFLSHFHSLGCYSRVNFHSLSLSPSGDTIRRFWLFSLLFCCVEPVSRLFGGTN